MRMAVAGKLDFSIHNDDLLNLTNFDVSNVNMWISKKLYIF